MALQMNGVDFVSISQRGGDDSTDRAAGKEQEITTSFTKTSDFGDFTIFTAAATANLGIKSITVRSTGALHADFTSVEVNGGTAKVLNFISAASGIRANLNAADKQVSWTADGGYVVLPASGTIVATFDGTANVNNVTLVFTVQYVSLTDGGYLS